MVFSAQAETVLFALLWYGSNAFIIEDEDETLFADTKEINDPDVIEIKGRVLSLFLLCLSIKGQNLFHNRITD